MTTDPTCQTAAAAAVPDAGGMECDGCEAVSAPGASRLAPTALQSTPGSKVHTTSLPAPGTKASIDVSRGKLAAADVDGVPESAAADYMRQEEEQGQWAASVQQLLDTRLAQAESAPACYLPLMLGLIHDAKAPDILRVRLRAACWRGEGHVHL